MEKQFRPFLDKLLAYGFEEFVTLYVPGPRPKWKYKNDLELLREAVNDLVDPKRRAAKEKRFQRAQDCYERWLSEVRQKAQGDQMRHICAIEVRASKRDCMFHVLLGGCDWGEHDFSDHWAPRWKELSDGVAFQRTLGDKVGGLLRYFVLKAHCVLEVDVGNEQGRFTASDFEP